MASASLAGGRTEAPMLPRLREDLGLEPSGVGGDGSPSWVIQDPVRNRFFRIGWLEFELLLRWHLRRPERVAAAVCEATPIPASPDDALALAQFLQQNDLVMAEGPGESRRLAKRAAAATGNRLRWLLHHYLFFRLPLTRPERFLRRTLPAVRFAMTPAFFVLAAMVTLLGLVLAGRQWDAFTAGVASTMTPAGVAGYLAALAVAKSLHEAGHAYVATRYGVRVAHMGVAFVVLWPMLYTDTGESWKLGDAWQRFRIAAAGMAAEMMLAGFATAAWALSPDGAFRDGCLFLATTSWALTVAINASPFMRFDGYYLLCDALDFPNLHERSFAFARAALRRTVPGLAEPDPEPLSCHRRRLLVAFALGVWAWRFALFLAIAVAVYVFFFKALGLFLFAVEIGWFIVRPIWREGEVWWRRRRDIPVRRRAGGAVVLVLILGGLFVPFRDTLRAPVWLHTDPYLIVFSPVPARLAAPLKGDLPVKRGDVLVHLESPQAEGGARVAEVAARTAALELDRLEGAPDGIERRPVVMEQLERELTALAGEREELARLELRAPFDGRLLDVDPAVGVGTWVGPRQALAALVNPDRWVAEAFVPEGARARLRPGATARLHLGRDAERLDAVVERIDESRVAALPHPALSAAQPGGQIAVAGDPAKLMPKETLYRVRLRVEGRPQRLAIGFGTAVIEGDAESLAGPWLRHAWAVLVRESGF